MDTTSPYCPELTQKIHLLKSRATAVSLGSVNFSSPLLLAPMSAICQAPFRLLMEELGAGGTVSELISCHGINHGNEKTRRMLRINSREQNVGLQLFGEDPQAMAQGAQVAQESAPKFIDINMGCPVRKVVTKGGGSALLRDTQKLGHFFSTIKKAIDVPLTIKIRTGWDSETLNAPEVLHIAKNEGIEFVAIHGRTRTQQYRGQANWDYLEMLARTEGMPIVGNGDLHTAPLVKQRLMTTACQALMLGRGPLRSPFIFLEPFIQQGEDLQFTPGDHLQVIVRLVGLLEEHCFTERTLLIQAKKHIVWFAAGFKGAAKFRAKVFQALNLPEVLSHTSEYFLSLEGQGKQLDLEKSFMAGGHG